jgi:uncharacterized protein (TIGR02118 family)
MAASILVLYNTPADPAAFDRHYAETHIPLAKRIPGLRSFTVSQGPIATPEGAAPYHLIITLTFDSMAAIREAFGSPEGAAATGDLANFAQAGATILMFESRDV